MVVDQRKTEGTESGGEESKAEADEGVYYNRPGRKVRALDMVDWME